MVNDGVIRVGSEIRVWDVQSAAWWSTIVVGFRNGVASMDGVLALVGDTATFVPWTMIG